MSRVRTFICAGQYGEYTRPLRYRTSPLCLSFWTEVPPAEPAPTIRAPEPAPHGSDLAREAYWDLWLGRLALEVWRFGVAQHAGGSR